MIKSTKDGNLFIRSVLNLKWMNWATTIRKAIPLEHNKVIIKESLTIIENEKKSFRIPTRSRTGSGKLNFSNSSTIFGYLGTQTKKIDTNKKTFNTSKMVSIVITNPQAMNKTLKYNLIFF